MSERRVEIVIPTYNEADNLSQLVADLLAAVPGAGITIVDDDSPDGTGRLADRLAELHEGVSVIHRGHKEGIRQAYVAGFDRALAAGAELIVQMDADFSHPPADVPRLIAACAHAELALGSRYVQGGGVARWGRLRRLISRAGSAYARRWLGLEIRDLTGGFKCWQRDALSAVDAGSIGSRGYAFQVEATWRAVLGGHRVVEIPIRFYDRRVGDSKMSRAIFLEAIWRVPLLRLRERSIRCRIEQPVED